MAITIVTHKTSPTYEIMSKVINVQKEPHMSQPFGAAGFYRAGAELTARVVVTTGNEIAGHTITEYLGIVREIIVRSPSIGQGIVGAIKQIVGGNIQEYADVCEAARHEAYIDRREARRVANRACHAWQALSRNRICHGCNRGSCVRSRRAHRPELSAALPA